MTNLFRTKMNSKDSKGFTLAEVLIVVAIIAVLVAVAFPLLTGELEKAREATDLANIRAAYGSMMTKVVSEGDAEPEDVSLKQTKDGWESGSTAQNTLKGLGRVEGAPTAKGFCHLSWTDDPDNPGQKTILFKFDGVDPNAYTPNKYNDPYELGQKYISAIQDAIKKGATIQGLSGGDIRNVVGCKDTYKITIGGKQTTIAEYLNTVGYELDKFKYTPSALYVYYDESKVPVGYFYKYEDSPKRYIFVNPKGYSETILQADLVKSATDEYRDWYATNKDTE